MNGIVQDVQSTGQIQECGKSGEKHAGDKQFEPQIHCKLDNGALLRNGKFVHPGRVACECCRFDLYKASVNAFSSLSA